MHLRFNFLCLCSQICDLDNDGVLNDEEVNLFQVSHFKTLIFMYGIFYVVLINAFTVIFFLMIPVCTKLF